MSNGNRTYSDIFYLFGCRYKHTVKIGQLGFMYPMIKFMDGSAFCDKNV